MPALLLVAAAAPSWPSKVGEADAQNTIGGS